MPVRLEIHKGRVPVRIFTDEVDSQTLDQLIRISQLPIVHHHVAAMPDVHLGIGATVGAVIATHAAVIPAAVGVDIGCGMNAVRLSLTAEQLPSNLARIRSAIEAAVPVGFDTHPEPVVPPSVLRPLERRLRAIVERHPALTRMVKAFDRTWPRQIGTLGGGNHFIELCLDEAGRVWIMLHSGSRGVGNAIGRYFIQLAKEEMGDRLGELPDRDLAWFDEGSRPFEDYMEAVGWAQDYAMTNRREMMRLILEAIRPHLPPYELTHEAINCHHNYVQREHHYGADVYVTRKGAIRAGKGELGIIPGSMGTPSYIVRGLGNEISFCSCAHGAGRRMSRNEAKRRFSTRDLENQTAGVECRKDRGVLDEIPSAYKDIGQVMENQRDLVEVVHTLRQLVCVKG